MSIYLARIDVISTGGVYYEMRDDESLLALAESMARDYGDDAVVTFTELDDGEVETLDLLRRSDHPEDRARYRLALVEISHRGG